MLLHAMLYSQQNSFFLVQAYLLPSLVFHGFNLVIFFLVIVGVLAAEFLKREIIPGQVRSLLNQLFKNDEYIKLSRDFLETKLKNDEEWKNPKISESNNPSFVANKFASACEESFEEENYNYERVVYIAKKSPFSIDPEIDANAFFNEHKEKIQKIEKEQMEYIFRLFIKLEKLDNLLNVAKNNLENDKNNPILGWLYQNVEMLKKALPAVYKAKKFKTDDKADIDDTTDKFKTAENFKNAFVSFNCSIEGMKVLTKVCDTFIPKIEDFNDNHANKMRSTSYIEPLIKPINTAAQNIQALKAKSNGWEVPQPLTPGLS